MSSCCKLCGAEDATDYQARRMLLCSPCGLSASDKVGRDEVCRNVGDIAQSIIDDSPADFSTVELGRAIEAVFDDREPLVRIHGGTVTYPGNDIVPLVIEGQGAYARHYTPRTCGWGATLWRWAVRTFRAVQALLKGRR